MKRILITCIGGHFSYQVVRSIQKTKKLSKFILGVDVNPNVNAFFVDTFEPVPRADLSMLKYVKKIIYLCKKYKINTILTSSENETLAISKYIKLFNKLKIKTAVSSFSTVNLMRDKLKMFEHLHSSNVDVGEWKKIDNFNDAENAVNYFGYPSNTVVIKPRFGSGSRGVLIVNGKKNSFTHLLKDRFCGEGSWEAIKEELKNSNKSLDNCFAMPYYGGETFDVDCIAEKGNLILAVPRLRVYQNPLSPINQGCIVGPNKDIHDYCKTLVKVFKINGACDFDIVIKKNMNPQLLDSSCRLSGSVGASLIAGVNVTAELIKMMHGKKLKKKKLSKKIKAFPTPIFVESL